MGVLGVLRDLCGEKGFEMMIVKTVVYRSDFLGKEGDGYDPQKAIQGKKGNEPPPQTKAESHLARW